MKQSNRKDARRVIDCENCGNPTKNDRFCSLSCSAEHVSKEQYRKFLSSPEDFQGEEYSPKSFKKFILKEQDCKCSICSIDNIWNGKELVFVLDHIDGNPGNNTRDNLRLVCPNCDSQLDTFKSRNKGSGRYYRTQRRLEGKSS